jgi:hypothetical protein
MLFASRLDGGSMTLDTLGMIIGFYALLMVASSVNLVLTISGFKP